MSLDVKVLQMLDRYAKSEEPRNKKDAQALDYINALNNPPSQAYLKAEYIKYYFKAKQDYKVKEIIEPIDLFKKDI